MKKKLLLIKKLYLTGLIILTAFIGLSLFVFTSRAEAATYYIDYEIGNDNSTGLSQSSPWKHSPGMAGATGVALATSLKPGDVVYFKKGVIWPAAALPLTPKAGGTASQPITYAALNGWGTGSYAIFDGGNVDTHAFDLDNYNHYEYIIADGFWFKDTVGEVVFARQNKNFTLQNCKVTQSNPAGLPLVRAHQKISIINCFIDGANATGEAVIMLQAGTVNDPEMVGSIVRGTEIITGGATYGLKLFGVKDGVVEKNYIHGAKANLYLLVWRSSDRGTIRYNIIDTRGTTNGQNAAIASWSAGAGPFLGHNVYNNILVGNGINTGFTSPSADYDGFNFVNNIFYDFNICIDSNSDATISNNNFFSCNTNWSGAAFTTSNNITAAPGLVNIDALPYGAKLQSTSPVINAGTVFDNFHNAVNKDYWGTKTPQSSAPAVGASEYLAGGQDATPPATPALEVQQQ